MSANSTCVQLLSYLEKTLLKKILYSGIPNQTLCICVKVCIVNELLEPHARFAPVYCHLLYYTLSKRKSSFYKTRPLICTLPCTVYICMGGPGIGICLKVGRLQDLGPLPTSLQFPQEKMPVPMYYMSFKLITVTKATSLITPLN